MIPTHFLSAYAQGCVGFLIGQARGIMSGQSLGSFPFVIVHRGLLSPVPRPHVLEEARGGGGGRVGVAAQLSVENV